MRVHVALVFALLLPAVRVTAATGAPVFGSVTAIGGSASDIALDESRSLLYVANFGAHTIQVMSTTDNTIHSSMNVLPWPGSLAISSDSQYLVATHYCNESTPAPCTNALTSIHLTDSSQRVFPLANPPLGVAFLANGQALVITTTNFLLFNPANGQVQLLATISNVAATLPVALATFPGQIIEAALAASADGQTIWGIASAGTSNQLIFQYGGAGSSLSAAIYVSSPPLLPRISSASDGSFATVGYALIGPGGVLKGRYPNVIASANITGNAIDSAHGIIYAQYPDANQPGGPATTSTGSVTPSLLPSMLILDSDNLTFRDRISIPEDMVGRALLNAAATMMYAVSESGVMVLPVGSLNGYHRVAATQEDILITTNFCKSGALSQSLTITDPGGGKTDFTVTSSQAGVTILPASGVTPATIQVRVDPTATPGAGGTAVVFLTLKSQTAVNRPRPIRLLINNPDPSQRGTIINQPGVLSDILPDPLRNRVYVARQDMNQIRVFDGNSMSLIATLRTATSPTMMAITRDGRYLMTGHDDSQLVSVYDLATLQAVNPILLPAGHFARSIAVANTAVLALARNEGGSPAGVIDSIDLISNTAAPLPTLGAFQNSVPSNGVLAASASGANVLLAGPEGTVALYTAAANTFVNSRHDLTANSGAFAASDYGSYVIGNTVFNASLVPSGIVSPATTNSSGFVFVNQGGFMTSAASLFASGSMLQVASIQPGAASPATLSGPVITSEAPLLPTAIAATSAYPAAYGTYGSGSTSAHALNSFARTIAPLPGAGMPLPVTPGNGNLVMLSTSGLTVLPSSYPASATPTINAITSAADGSLSVAPGGLISIYGQNMSSFSLAASGTPLSTALGDSCTGVNGSPVPLLYVSPQQINAQLPFGVSGNTTLTIHTPGGVSNNYSFTVQPTAPSVFLSGTAGPETGLATIVRNSNNQLVTPTNPIHPKDVVIIYLTGMGQTSPAVQTGQPAPADPLAYAAVAPVVTLGSSNLTVSYAGLVPGLVGVYQINATVPSNVATGLAIPLAISQGGAATTLNVRVVN